MSRSYKDYPHIGFANSEKFDKRFVNRRFRRRAKIILATSSEPSYIALYDFPLREDIKDRYNFAKDGGIDLDSTDDFYYFLNGKLRK